MQPNKLLAPKSVAIWGASTRPSLGLFLIESLTKLGFSGAVYPVNPKYEEISGLRCYPSLLELPEAPDVVACCVNVETVVAEFGSLAEARAGGAVIYDGGFAESGVVGERRQARIEGIAKEAGIALCGPNCMGVLNPVARSTTFLQPVRDASSLAGNVGLISQSGSVAASLLADVRRFGFSLAVSSGNEAVLSSSVFLEHLIIEPSVKVIALFLETVREPERFIAALDGAAAAGKPVVALKVGKSERARRAVQSHTGGLAGASNVFSEALRAHRAIEVNDLAEMTEVLAALQSNRWPAGSRICAVTTSGGQAEMILDAAAASGVELPALPAELREEISTLLGPLGGEANPLDVWGQNNGASASAILDLLGASEAADAIVFCTGDTTDGQPLGRPGRELGYAQMLATATKTSRAPLYLLNTRQNIMHRGQLELLRAAGTQALCGSSQSLLALDRIGKWRREVPPFVSSDLAACTELAAARSMLNEFEAKALLARHSLPTTREALVATLEEAQSVAEQIGYPVVLKAVSNAIAHKSDHGLVALDLADIEKVRSAFDRLSRIAKDLDSPIQGYVVQEFIEDGIEVFAGVTRDPQFGLTLAFGMGGIAVEIMRDFSLRMLPLRRGDIEAMIGEVRGGALLEAYRGRPPADKAALIACLYDLAAFAFANRDRIAEIDLNPIKVRREGEGCVIVDALIVCKP